MLSRGLIKKQPGRRWLTGLATLGLLSSLLLAGGTALAVHDVGLFELDKDAVNDETAVPIGTLRSNIDSSQTTFQVCQTASANPSTIPNILIDGEEMDLTTVATATGGGCSGTFKRTYTVATRTGGAAHSGGELVTLLAQAAAGIIAGDDWDSVYAALQGGDEDCSSIGAVECALVSDPKGLTVFKQGSTDIEDVDTWDYADMSAPDADEIVNAYAVKYVYDGSNVSGGIQNGDQVLYFGADRFATNGSKDFGFWFFKNEVDAVGGVFVDGDGNPAVHAIGDILILGTFTQGGAATTVRVFEWVGVGDPSATAGGIAGPDATLGDCVPGSAKDEGCATVNNTTIQTGGWTYLGKGESANGEIPSGGFLEGGINLTELNLQGCFSSFMAETRSSPSLTAELKDFILGSFEACQSGLTTTPANSSGTNLSGPVSIGTGSVLVTDNAHIDITGIDEWDGTLTFFLCGPLDAPDTCTIANGGVQIGSPIAVDEATSQPITSSPATLTEAGRYCWRGEFDSATSGVDDAKDDSAGECFVVNPVTPTLTTTAVEPFVGLSPTIVDGLADLNGDGVVNGDDDSNAFYGNTSIINGALDCNAWTSDNDGTAGDGVIGDGSPDPTDDCTLIGVDGSLTGVTIEVVAGEFQTADGPLPVVFNAGDPDNPDVGDSDFAWSTIFGRVDSDGQNPEAITGNDCHVGIIGGANILGSTCGLSPTPPAAFNGYIDLNGDGKATSADSCSTGCFFGRDVFNGLVKSGAVDFGQNLYDVATLTGTANQEGDNGGDATYPSINATNGLPADSKITFTLVGPDDCTSTPTGTGTNPQDVNVSGDGFYLTSGFAPNAPGDYHWKASYLGDGPNTNAASDVACPVTSETVEVRQIPTAISTAQSWYPQDSATITSSDPSDTLVAGGTVEFRLFGPTDGGDPKTALENCQADDGTGTSVGLVYSESPTLTGGLNSETLTTDNTTFAVTTNDIYYWLVTYTPTAGDDLHTGRISECAETFNITFTNDSGPGEVFP